MVESPARLSEALTCPIEADAYIGKIADEALKVERVNDVPPRPALWLSRHDLVACPDIWHKLAIEGRT
jgi:hypothetical protein